MFQLIMQNWKAITIQLFLSPKNPMKRAKLYSQSVIYLKGPYRSIFDFSPLTEIYSIFYKMLLLKRDHVFTLVDLRLHF